jgi:(R,R)-butanediol dehydrogenase / meso-butanediol dehydrogenase / diacetyl reductase
MSALVLHGRRDLRVESVPVPHPSAGEVVLAVSATGVCGTDAAEWGNGPSMFPVETRHPVTGHLGPMIPGHEFSGRVVAVGAGVDTAAIGELVASCGASPCGRCRVCRTGRTNQCERYETVGLHRNGALAGYVATPWASCVAVGGLGLSGDEAALVQPMGIAVHALRRSGACSGERVLVQGVGGVGAFLIYALAELGAEVVATDLRADRLELARALGATVAIDVSGDAVPGVFDVVCEVTGSPAGLTAAVGLAAAGTRVVVVGIQKAPREVDVRRLTLQEIQLIGTNALVRESDLPEAARLIASRSAGWADICSTVLPLAAGPDAIAQLAAGRALSVKMLVSPGAAEPRSFQNTR